MKFKRTVYYCMNNECSWNETSYKMRDGIRCPLCGGPVLTVDPKAKPVGLDVSTQPDWTAIANNLKHFTFSSANIPNGLLNHKPRSGVMNDRERSDLLINYLSALTALTSATPNRTGNVREQVDKSVVTVTKELDELLSGQYQSVRIDGIKHKIPPDTE